MRIGITERGDAGLDLSWKSKMHTVDGAVLITKSINNDFIDIVLKEDKPVIVHCTCTGYGGTVLEPNVHPYHEQLSALRKLIDMGFPEERTVIRVDPIIPTPKGCSVAGDVLYTASCIFPKYAGRVRFSFIDVYEHIKKRYPPFCTLYSGTTPPTDAIKLAFDYLKLYRAWLGRPFQACAENFGSQADDMLVKCTGCISQEDIRLLGLQYDKELGRKGQRSSCMCLSCKTELLTNRHPCANGCLYCYWRD